MEFRPCIDIHNGKVKQIVGGSLQDAGNQATENFVAEASAAEYASMYQRDNKRGGHVILLNARDSEFYEATKREAMAALSAFPGGMQVGGGIQDDNAAEFLDAGAYGVIVTSFVFRGGQILEKNLERMVSAVGKEHLVLDLSCRKKGDKYFVVTDRWQKFTDIELTSELLKQLSGSAVEFLIHAADVEGKQNGIDEEVAKILGAYAKSENAIPVTYAGGIRSMEDIEKLRELGDGAIHFTIGSALDLFGGKLSYQELAKKY